MNAIVPVTASLLTPRWKPLSYHATQQAFLRSTARFNVVPAGRRSGKTEIAKRRLVRKAMRGSRFDVPRYFAAAPTRQQAKDIYWDDLKRLVPNWMKKGSPSESELVIRLITDTEIHVEGLDKPERIEGSPWDGGIIDEYGNIKSKAWDQNIRPALSDRNGYADLIGVPEGMNHYYDKAQEAQAHMAAGDPSWAYYHWYSADILPPEEIAQAMRDLDELTFNQEYRGSFVNFQGLIYYTFDRPTHASRPLAYDPNRELIFCFDFNVAPGVAAIVQEQKLPNGAFGTGIIAEVHIPLGSNTHKVCDKIIELYGQHRGDVRCYGDASGGASGTAKVDGSDWDLIRKKLLPVFGQRLGIRVPPANPPERARVNAMNSRLKTVSGAVHMMVDPRCKNVIKDFEGVRVLEGSSGEIEKKKTPLLTHLTDGIGYYVQAKFPVADRTIQLGKTQGH